MIVRLGLVVAASIAAYSVRQINIKPSKPPSDSADKPSGNGGASLEEIKNEEENKEQLRFDNGYKENDGKEEEEEEEEEVKQISDIINSASGKNYDFEEDELIPEFEELLSGAIDVPFSSDNFNAETKSAAEQRDKVYEAEMTNNAIELERLRNLVKELEGELLEYYGMKEQESDVVELQKQIKIKTVEIDMLNITINSLQTERKKLQEEVAKSGYARKDLEVARKKIKEPQRQIQLEANQTKGQPLLLKQQVSSLHAKEEEAFQRDAEV